MALISKLTYAKWSHKTMLKQKSKKLNEQQKYKERDEGV